MQADRSLGEGGVGEFGGIMGRVLRGAMGGRSLFTGILLGILLFTGNWVFGQVHAEELATPFTQIVVALALARFAVNGLYGEWEGSIISSSGGSWSQVGKVALRYLALNALWIAPLLILGLKPEAVGNQVAAMALGQPAGHALELFLLYVTGMMIAPPIFLIASVGAERFTDLVSAAHWKRLFASRFGDLFSIYTVYLGALAALVIVSIPIGVAIAVNSLNAALFVGSVFLTFLIGLGVTLLGRLCGFFAFGEVSPEAMAGHHPPSYSPDAGRPIGGGTGPRLVGGESGRFSGSPLPGHAPRGTAESTVPPGSRGASIHSTMPPGVGRASGNAAYAGSAHAAGGAHTPAPGSGAARRTSAEAHSGGPGSAAHPQGHAGTTHAAGQAFGSHSSAYAGTTHGTGQAFGAHPSSHAGSTHATGQAMGPHSSAHGGSSHTGSQSVGSHAPIHAGTAQAALASHWGAGGHAPLGGHPFHPHGKAPLLDASERVGVARARFESDPESAVRLLEELRGEFAPSPHVLHALCLMRAHAGQPEQAVALAREALPLCFQRGHLVFAAEIIRALWAQVDHLGIGREHSLVVASTLRKAGDLQTSCKLYKRVLGNDRAEPRAIKGLMNSADTMIEDPAQIDEALRIYEFLLMTCKTSRLVEDMRRGHEEAVRRKARVHDLEPAHAGR